MIHFYKIVKNESLDVEKTINNDILYKLLKLIRDLNHILPSQQTDLYIEIKEHAEKNQTSKELGESIAEWL